MVLGRISLMGSRRVILMMVVFRGFDWMVLDDESMGGSVSILIWIFL